MMEAVHRYEGTVNQVLGDGIMALFGAPLAHEDHALRACYAALATQAAMRRSVEAVRRSQGVEVQIRVGLNSGGVVVRAIGNDLHMDYSVVGQTTHLAARMEQLAPPGSTRLTAATLRLVEGLVQVNTLGPVPVKGLTEPVDVFELVGASSIPRRLQVTAARGLTCFVGRQREIDILYQALERAGAGHGQVVAVFGELGVGKSRLVYEFIRSHRSRGWLVLESASVSYDKATAYFPVIDLLKHYFHVEDSDDPRTVRAKVIGQVLTLDEALQETIPAFLDNLVESLPTAHLLLLVNYRPEYQHGWGSKTYYAQLRLDPLLPASADELLQALLGDDASLRPLKQLLIERTEGNPFFLEENVRTLVETQVLVGERGRYRLAQALPNIQVPATVQAVLAACIDRLPAEEKRLLQTAAVIGTEVPFPLLQTIAEVPDEALRTGLAPLQAAEFLYETRLFPELEYTFKHALTHEVAYGSLLQERRRTLHARIADALEELYPDRLGEQIDRLAHHAFLGEVWDKALPYCRQAGAKAFARSANREAVACFERALGALKHLPESRDLGEQAIEICFDLRNALSPLAELGRILHHLREAEIRAKVLDDQHRLGWASAYMSNAFLVMGDQERAIESSQRALTIARGDFALQVTANYNLGQAYHILGDYPRAIEFLSENMAALEGELIRERLGMAGLLSVLSRAWLVAALAEMGAFAEGIPRAEEGVRIAEAADHPFSLIRAYSGVAALYLRKGDFSKAMPVLERLLELCQMWKQPLWLPHTAAALGYVYALGERVAEALPLLEQAVEQAATMGLMTHQSLRVAWLSEAYLLARRADDATTIGFRAIELYRSMEMTFWLPQAEAGLSQAW